MDRRKFLTSPVAILSAAAFAQEARALDRRPMLYLQSTPMFHEACRRAIARSWDAVPCDVGVLHDSWQLPDSPSSALHQYRDDFPEVDFTGAILVEREENVVPETFIRDVEVACGQILRVAFADSRHYSQTRRAIPPTIVLSAQRRGKQTVVRAPRVWEAQLFDQFSRAAAQDDGSRTLDDFERVGPSMSELFWRQDELVADIVGGLMRKLAECHVLEDAVAKINCQFTGENLAITTVSML